MASKSPPTSSPQPQTHDYYIDDISDDELLNPVPELAMHFAKHGEPKFAPLTLDKVAHFRKQHLKNVGRFNVSPFAHRVLGVPPSTDLSSPASASVRDSLPWTETDTTIPMRDGATIAARIYLPRTRTGQKPSRPLPVCLFVHCGGWFMGDLSSDAVISRLFATRAHCMLVDIDYRRLPDVPCGVPTLDSYDAACWIAQNAPRFGGDCRLGFVLAGSSGGGSCAAVAAHMAREEGLDPPVTGVWLGCPVLLDIVGGVRASNVETPGAPLFDHARENRSQVHNANAPLMNRALQEGIISIMPAKDFISPLMTPFVSKTEARFGYGRVYVQVAGMDPWRDSGRIYARMAERAGKSVKLDVYPGLPHCWWNTFTHLSATDGWARDAVAGLNWLLRGTEMVDMEMDGGGEGETKVLAKL